MTFYDYRASADCINSEAFCMCLKCGECGRYFDDSGKLIDPDGDMMQEWLDMVKELEERTE